MYCHYHEYKIYGSGHHISGLDRIFITQDMETLKTG